MRKLISVLLPLALMASFKALPDKAMAGSQPVKQTVSQQEPSNARSQNTKPGDPLSPFEKDGSVKSSFPHGVVQRLNAIVAKSKNAIDRFDKVRPGFESAIAAAKAAPDDATALSKAKAALKEMDALQKEAAAAKASLADEGKKLLKSGQYYDQVIFAGMARFVSKVDKEMADEKKMLIASLPK